MLEVPVSRACEKKDLFSPAFVLESHSLLAIASFDRP